MADGLERTQAESRERLLKLGLIGTRRTLYETSAQFHASIDTLALMLPAMVEGLAIAAESTDARHAQMVEELMRRPIGLVSESWVREQFERHGVSDVDPLHDPLYEGNWTPPNKEEPDAEDPDPVRP